MNRWVVLGEAVRRRRMALRLSPADLADRADMDVAKIGWIEGGHPVSMATLRKVDRGLGWLGGSAEALLADGTPPGKRLRSAQPQAPGWLFER